MAHTEKEYKRSGLEGLICTACKMEKGTAAFSQTSKPYANGTPRYKAQCNECLASKKGKSRKQKALDSINRRQAPIFAAKRLVEKNPEALLLLAQRFRAEFVVLLDEERARLVKRHEHNSASNKRTKVRLKLAAQKGEVSSV